MIGQGGTGNALELRHFDPYSVVLRLIARGDEPDYVAALEYVLHGWVEPARLESLLGEVVPRMTNQTLAQDPAEFRRKFKGLRQLYLALELRHFDPYSVVLRLIARGDEPDYVAALEYVLHEWVEPAKLEGLLAEVVPRMTNQTLAQDPAEFRRKFKGLRQLYLRSHAVYSPGGTRAGDAVSSS